ncbi:MAG: bifunctional phosphoglucose/phosphomannose isomerase [Armatimonadetes bacterium]|nr:bifunctional phosphoglucose/phosphomannose isomerase [Armatimonadota bacterium]
MPLLDDRAAVTAHDPSGFVGLVEDFPEQCLRTLEIVRGTPLPDAMSGVESVVLTGLGGSAAGGDFAKGLYDTQSTVPFQVNRDYHLPHWVGIRSLVFAASYSGNTEETLAAYDEAKGRGAKIVAVTSGGALADKAKADGYPLVVVPGGQPPRTALGYMLMPVVYASDKFGLLPKQDYEGVIATLFEARDRFGLARPQLHNDAKQLAEQLSGKVGLLYAAGAWQAGVANRWKGQINENAKEMVFTHVFPELCHNEILGWEGSAKQGVASWLTVLLLGGDESPRMLARIAATFSLIEDKTSFAKASGFGESLLARMLSLAHFGDYVSVYMAALAGRDPAAMVAIDRLKAELAKIDAPA